MKENGQKTDFITLKVWRKTLPQLKEQAVRDNMSLSEYIHSLCNRDSGLEEVAEIAIPLRKYMHRESYKAGHAAGYVEACANLARSRRDLANNLYHALLSDPRLAAEWDLHILREFEPAIPRGRLVKDHPRAPKAKP